MKCKFMQNINEGSVHLIYVPDVTFLIYTHVSAAS